MKIIENIVKYEFNKMSVLNKGVTIHLYTKLNIHNFGGSANVIRIPKLGSNEIIKRYTN